MANPKHLEVLKKGVKAWNNWRHKNEELLMKQTLARRPPDGPEAKLVEEHQVRRLLGVNSRMGLTGFQRIDLGGIDLSGALLDWANFNGADLRGSCLSGASLVGATFNKANLVDADMREVRMEFVDLRGADLRGAHLDSAHLEFADLTGTLLDGAYLVNARLEGAKFKSTSLDFTHLDGATVGDTSFEDVDLTTSAGLSEVNHSGRSYMSVDTLYRSAGQIPEEFLRGCGLPEDFIFQLPGLIASAQPIQFHSCFISYSHEDSEFADRLHSRLQSEGIRVWFAPEEMKSGLKLHEQIFSAIQVQDKLLLILSETSMKSGWVGAEIRRARRVEHDEGRRKLFPIRLADIDAIKKWELFDVDIGHDLATEVREYFIPNFSNWRNDDEFEAAFVGLVSDLRIEEDSGNWSPSSRAVRASNRAGRRFGFDIHLLEVGENKIEVIKCIREFVDLTLKEIVDLANSAPTVIANVIDREVAEGYVMSLRRAGAKSQID